MASFDLPKEGVTFIGEQALQGTAIVSLNIPTNVQIGANAFRGCQSIANVFSFNTVPPVLDDLAFSDIVEIEQATLHVPFGTKAVYSQAPGWKAFTNIVEEDLLSVDEVALDNVLFAAQGEALSISGLNSAQILVYNLEGKMLVEANAYEAITLNLGRGHYIVVVSQEGKRIVKKIAL